MPGQTENYGWDYVNSGADPVSGPQNFQHVQQIDTTLAQLMGNGTIMSMRVGSADMTGGCVEEVHVEIDPPAQGDAFFAIVSSHSSVPGTVQEVSALNETANGFDIQGCRSNTTNYTVNWLMFGVAQS